MEPCSNPGCTEPGTHKCSACKTTPYCGVKCQSADWPSHKESCPGHLRKIGTASLEKAKGFLRQRNFEQALKHCNLALTKLKLLTKDRPLEAISDALRFKCDSLGKMGRFKEDLECTREWYNLWAMERGPAHPRTIDAAFSLIESLVFNEEWDQAELFARTLWEILNSSNHHFEEDRIPDDKRQMFLARGAVEYARATWLLARAGGIPPEKKQNRGEEAIALARRALEIYTQLHGTESSEVANTMDFVANALDYFNDVDDIEVIRLYERSLAICARMEGITSLNFAIGEYNLGNSYFKRADRAQNANDLDRELANLELGLPHFREAARVFKAINITDRSDDAEQRVAEGEKTLRETRIIRASSSSSSAAAAATASTTTTTTG